MEREPKWTAKEIIKNGTVTQSDFDKLKTWARGQADLPSYPDELFLSFLIAYKEQDDCRRVLAEYTKIVRGTPELFTNRNIEQLQEHLTGVETAVIPRRTDDGYAIIFQRAKNVSYWYYNYEAALKIICMTAEAVLCDYPTKGLIVLFDMEYCGLMHLTKMKYGLSKKFFHLIREALPISLKAVHVMNVKYFINKIFYIIGPLMGSELMSLIHLHSKGEDMQHFYDNCIPQKCLPKEYGGDLPSISDLNDQTISKLKGLGKYFEEEEKIIFANLPK